MKNLFPKQILTLLTVISFWGASNIKAQSLDNSFATNGILTDTEGGFSRKTLIQPDGKIVLAGYSGSGNERRFITIRYNEDGSRDNTFGTNGKVEESFGGLDARCFDAELLGDGKMVLFGNINPVSGSQERNVVVLKLNTDGSVDNTFGTNGISTFSVQSGNDFVNSALVQPDGKLVIVGRTRILDTYQDDGFVVRLNADGSLDNSFGTNGILVFDSGFQKSEILLTVSLANDGSIIAGGTYYPGGGSPNHSLVVKVTPGGQLDPSFDTDGIYANNFTGSDEDIYSLYVDQVNNDIYTAVYESVTGVGTNLMVKLSSSAQIDLTYGINGKLPFGTGTIPYEIKKDASGNVFLCGNKTMDYILYKFNSAMVPDSSFGNDGSFSADLAGSSDAAFSIAFQNDGKIVLSGTSVVGVNNSFSAIRIDLNGTIATPPADPSNLSATVFKTQSNYIELTWNDNANNEDGFGIERSLDGQNYVAIDSVSSDIVSFQDYDLIPLTTYYYRVFAFNTIGNSGLSNVVQVTTDASVGMAETAKEKIEIYPNPFQQEVHITLPENAMLEIKDITGRICVKTAGNTQIKTLFLPNLPKGIYFLSILSDQIQLTRQLIKN